MNSEHGASTRAVGTAAVFLRPLRYMFDVETDVALVCDEESVLPFESVHVHVRAATRPPLMERDVLFRVVVASISTNLVQTAKGSWTRTILETEKGC